MVVGGSASKHLAAGVAALAWEHSAPHHQPLPHIPRNSLLSACAQTYVALARIDPDAAWCQLSAALAAASGATLPGPAPSTDEPPACGPPASEQPRVPPCLALKTDGGAPLSFPPWGVVAPPPPVAASGPAGAASGGAAAATRGEAGPPALTVPPGLRDCGAAKLAAILRQVEQLPPQWHKQVEALLARP